jgi:hypothetical protein
MSNLSYKLYKVLSVNMSRLSDHVYYQTYLKSSAWKAKHPIWLNAVGNRCTMFPWITIGKGKPYIIHHLHYRNLGYEELGRDILPVSQFAHRQILHGLLSGWRLVPQQKQYPNLAQRAAHFWMSQRLWFKVLLMLSLLGYVIWLKITT